MTTANEILATKISDLDPTEPGNLYCGNCGTDYSGMTVGDLKEHVGHRGCPACKQYLAEFIADERRRITISGNWRKNGPENEWAGSGTVDQYGAVECSANLDGDAYDLIEEQIANGDTEGSVTVEAEDGREITYHWEIAE